MTERKNDAGSHNSCPSRKMAYLTRKAAKAALRQIRGKKGRSAVSAMREYDCPDCAAWHVGHMPADVRRGSIGAREIYRKAVDTD